MGIPGPVLLVDHSIHPAGTTFQSAWTAEVPAAPSTAWQEVSLPPSPMHTLSLPSVWGPLSSQLFLRLTCHPPHVGHLAWEMWSALITMGVGLQRPLSPCDPVPCTCLSPHSCPEHLLGKNDSWLTSRCLAQPSQGAMPGPAQLPLCQDSGAPAPQHSPHPTPMVPEGSRNQDF